ncbi:cobalt-precorrin-5B (C(1))-methyltransferase CbiD [Neosynechococcus sphagnicola]|uniref:cobalt-precorrin-5B (C(1))-methyltransferase CbiD n=1 Tax=Neosynechococcus sphagnicola TaxID=1501145 RepID=UPI0023BA6C06|nr:cobalt-precorrin-5B (C(1))-methyltransferase CbiD [Neosynechococcus sphagnicola]
MWALVQWQAEETGDLLQIRGGEGIGTVETEGGRAAIYAYAQRLLRENLSGILPPDRGITVTLILPEGRSLAMRTANAAFGVVEGLSLLGTTGISQPLSAPAQLADFRSELQQKAGQYKTLVFCVGENGLDLALQLGIEADLRLKTANWLGPLLVEAGLQKVEAILLFGYHGKLLKLAGNIFHTHHHVADARLEILTAHCANLGLPPRELQTIFASATAEDALNHLRELDVHTNRSWVSRVYGAIADRIDQRSQAYIYTHSEQSVAIGCLLFDRRRQVIVTSERGSVLLRQMTRS